MRQRSRLLGLVLASVVVLGAVWYVMSDVAPLASQVLRTASPEAQGFSADRLKRIDEVMQRYVDEGLISGMVTLVARHGEIVQLEAFGAADRDRGTPMRTDTMFRLASISKLITTVGLLQLVEEGRLLVTDPVSKYLPEFASTTVAVAPEGGATPDVPYTVVPARRQITLHDLLTKTPGIAYPQGATQEMYEALGLEHGWYFAHMDQTMCEIMRKLPSVPFHAHPGEEWFNGYTADVLGCVIELVSGMTLDDHLRTRIFEPLGMHDTYFVVPQEKADRLAAVYSAAPDGGIVRSEGVARNGQGDFVEGQGPGKAFSGGAGLVSTATDYARFLQMLLNGGELDGARVLGPKTVQMISQNHVGDLYQNGALGFGFNVDVREERSHDDRLGSVGTYSWSGAYFTRFWVDPAEGLIGVFLAQLLPYGGSSDLHPKFQALVYQALTESAQVPAVAELGGTPTSGKGLAAGHIGVDQRGETTMMRFGAMQYVIASSLAAVLSAGSVTIPEAAAQETTALQELSRRPTSTMENPYRMLENWPTLRPGMEWGAAIGLIPDDTGGLWMLFRSEPAINYINADGQITKSFGEGVIVQAHGFCMDNDGNLWAGDSGPFGDDPSTRGRGFQIHKFSQDGQLLMSLGQAGVSRAGRDTFIGPTACAVAPDGNIVIADGHWPRPSTAQQDGDRLVVVTPQGEFVRSVGRLGDGPGEFMGPHALAFDSQGRLFVADRSNNRVQVLDSDLNWVDEWRHFGRPSGITVLDDGTLLVADSESGGVIPGPPESVEGANAVRNPGWQVGIRIGEARNGSLRYFIPGTRPEGMAGDNLGNIFAGLTGGCDMSPSGGCLQKWVKR